MQQTNRQPLVDWLLSLDRIDVTRCNAKGQDAFAIAKELGRSAMLTGAVGDSPPPPGNRIKYRILLIQITVFDAA
jgi:hypothetical protein